MTLEKVSKIQLWGQIKGTIMMISIIRWSIEIILIFLYFYDAIIFVVELWDRDLCSSNSAYGRSTLFGVQVYNNIIYI